MNKLIQSTGILIAIISGVVAVMGLLNREPGVPAGALGGATGGLNNEHAVYMALFGFVAMAFGIAIWLVARWAAWWSKP